MQTSLPAVQCSQWNGMGYAILSMRNTSVDLPPVSNLTPAAVSLQTLLYSTNYMFADVFCNHLPKCFSYFSILNHLSGFLVISPKSWLLLPMMNQPLHTLSLFIWHSYLQSAKALNFFGSMLISIIPSISNWIWDAFCRLVFLSSTSIFVFGIVRSSRRTDSIKRPITYFYSLLQLFTLPRIQKVKCWNCLNKSLIYMCQKNKVVQQGITPVYYLTSKKRNRITSEKRLHWMSEQIRNWKDDKGKI